MYPGENAAMGQKNEARFRALMEKADYLTNISQTLSWDMRVMLPAGAAAYRGAEIGFLAGQLHALQTSEEMEELLLSLEADPPEDPVTRAMAAKARRTFDTLKRVPEDLYADCSAHTLRTEQLWPRARAESDYELIRPQLEQAFAYRRALAACWGFEDDPLTGLMDRWEAGDTRAETDALFRELKAALVPLVQRLRDLPPPDRTPLLGDFPKAQQKALCRQVLTAVGFDFERGRVDESAHPYTTFNHRGDVRITCRYFEDDFTRAVGSSLHEGGHAIYWQNIGEELAGTGLDQSASLALDESQARFLECMLGRSLPFWQWALPLAGRHFPALAGTDPEAFWRGLNAFRPTPLRLEADELSYNLHILLRYELEKELFDGALSFRDLPEAWNERSASYLGVRPRSDGEGVLQDMHWFSGYIGYFQSYTLGNCYAAQFLEAMEKDLPDLFDRVRQGDFASVKAWNGAHIHRFGATRPARTILRDATGEDLNAGRYVRYLTDKYARVYGL